VKGNLQNTAAKSLFDPIPPDFCFYVPESQNVPNHHHHHHHLFFLFQILVLGMTTNFLLTFNLCVPESQNAPNLLHMVLFCGTTY